MTGRGRLSLVAVLGAMAMVVLDAGMLNVALPTLSAAIHVDLAHGIWAVSAYQMALLAGLLPSAQLAERFGQRTVFGIGLVVYLGASVLCAASPNLTMLIAARTAQGLGGAVIMALGISILRAALGNDRLGRAIGWNALVVALSSAAAPSIAAIILSLATWPWLFLAKLPLGLLALAATAGLPRARETRTSIDALGIAIHVAIAAIILATFDRLIDQPVVSIGLMAAAVGLARWMVSRQPAGGAPLWPLDLLANRPFRMSVVASVACFAGQTAGLVALPVMLQAGSGLGVADTALIMTCWPVSVAVTAPVSGRLAERCGSPVLCAAGGAILSAGLAASCFSAMAGSLPAYATSAMLCGIGFGLFQVPNNRTLFLSAPDDRAAAAGGTQGSARLMGQSLGALIVGLFLGLYPPADAAMAAMVVGALCAAAASLASVMNLPHLIARRHA